MPARGEIHGLGASSAHEELARLMQGSVGFDPIAARHLIEQVEAHGEARPAANGPIALVFAGGLCDFLLRAVRRGRGRGDKGRGMRR